MEIFSRVPMSLGRYSSVTLKPVVSSVKRRSVKLNGRLGHPHATILAAFDKLQNPVMPTPGNAERLAMSANYRHTLFRESP